MRKFGMILGVATIAFLGACTSTTKTNANAGAMGTGACSEKKSECCKEKAAAGSMGAVGEKKAGECSQKTSTSTDKPAGSMGAVSEKKDGCCPSQKQ